MKARETIIENLIRSSKGFSHPGQWRLDMFVDGDGMLKELLLLHRENRPGTIPYTLNSPIWHIKPLTNSLVFISCPSACDTAPFRPVTQVLFISWVFASAAPSVRKFSLDTSAVQVEFNVLLVALCVLSPIKPSQIDH